MMISRASIGVALASGTGGRLSAATGEAATTGGWVVAVTTTPLREGNAMFRVRAWTL